MNIDSPVYTVPTECQDCYRCIRRCPVKAIRVENGHAVVVRDLCIACGRCVTHCPSHAKRYRDDTDATYAILKKKRVILSLAPSWRAEFPNVSADEMVAMLKQLGFFGVSETALGADIVSYETAKELEEGRQNNPLAVLPIYISSACPAAVEYIKRYMGSYAPYIMDCASPLLAHARYLHKIYGDDIGVVFAGPCIAKKREADAWSEIDIALTFRELHAMLDKAGVASVRPAAHMGADGVLAMSMSSANDNTATSFIPRRAAKGEYYPIEGGMIATCKKYSPLKNVRTIAVTGPEAIHDTLNGLDMAEITEPLFIEALACRGGCINGPGGERMSALALRRMQVVDFAMTADNVLDDETIANRPSMTGVLPGDPVGESVFSEEQIREAMRSIGKYSVADEINCNGCGYETCRHFAEAMLRGMAEKTMCVSHMRRLAQKKANGLVKAIPSGVVIVNKDMSIVECNQNFARLMGQDIVDMYEVKPGLEGADLSEMTKSVSIFKSVLVPGGPEVVEREVREKKRILHYIVFVIEKEEIAAGVVEDVTAPKNQKARTIEKAQNVIDKNLATVQKIAFLLGENAAETESMLNSIIESYSLDDSEESSKSTGGK